MGAPYVDYPVKGEWVALPCLDDKGAIVDVIYRNTLPEALKSAALAGHTRTGQEAFLPVGMSYEKAFGGPANSSRVVVTGTSMSR